MLFLKKIGDASFEEAVDWKSEFDLSGASTLV